MGVPPLEVPMLVLALLAAAAFADESETRWFLQEVPDGAAQQLLEVRTLGTLGSWALGNIATGAVGWAFADDPRAEGVWQMNLAWNVVNLGIVTAGALGASRVDLWNLDADALRARQRRLRTAFLVNAGLDVGYVAAGIALRQWALSRGKGREQGFGESLVVQGGFLLVFDVVAAVAQARLMRRS